MGIKKNIFVLMEVGYPKHKAETEKRNNPASFYIYRPMSWPLTWVALRLGIGPIAVTLFGLVTALSGLMLLALGHFIYGAMLLNLSYVLDQVDGNVARLTNRTSRRGAWLDSLVGYLYNSFMLLALAIGLFFSLHSVDMAHEGFVLFGATVELGLVLVLGVIGSAAILIRKQGVLMSSEHRESVSQEGPGDVHSDLAKGGGLAAIPKAVNSFAIFLLLVAVVLGFEVVYLFGYSVFQLLLMLMVLGVVFRRLK